MATVADDTVLEDLKRRLAQLEGWREGQEKFNALLQDYLKSIADRLASLEAAVHHMDERWEARIQQLERRIQQLEERWEARIQQLERRWDTRIQQLEERWEAGIQQLEANWETRFQHLEHRWETRLREMDERWEARFSEMEQRFERRFGEIRDELRELNRRFWYLMGFQFTVLLAVLALVSNLLFRH
ncbi:MAG: hypothetical protein ACP5NF_06340 [Thermoanaerobaculum sp.]